MKKMKYATTMFSGITKSAYVKVEKDFFKFMDDTYNENMHFVSVNNEYYHLLIDIDRYRGFDRGANDPLSDKEVEYIDALDKIVDSARFHGLNKLEVESEDD